MNQQILVLSVIAIGASALCAGCGDDTVGPEDGSIISGTVSAYICAPEDPANDTISRLYSIETGRQAEITFEPLDNDDIHQVTVYTNSHSAFTASLPDGQWKTIVMTDHGWPTIVDTVTVPDNTPHEYAVRYRYRDPDTLFVTFEFVHEGPGNIWDPDGPTMSDYVDSLAADAGGLLAPDQARFWVDTLEYYNRRHFNFAVPLAYGARMYDVMSTLGGYAFRLGPNALAGYPDMMSVYALGFGLCPDDFDFDSTWYDTGGGFIDPGEPDSTGGDTVIPGP